MKCLPLIVLAMLVVAVASVRTVRAGDAEPGKARKYTLSPIGFVRKAAGQTTIVLDIKPFLPGYDSKAEAKVPDWVGRK